MRKGDQVRFFIDTHAFLGTIVDFTQHYLILVWDNTTYHRRLTDVELV